MTPQGLRHAINLNLCPITTRCPKCTKDVPPDRMLTIEEPTPPYGMQVIVWHGCLECLNRADARMAAMQDGEIPLHGRSLIRTLWHYLTMQRPTQAEVDAVAVDVQQALG